MDIRSHIRKLSVRRLLCRCFKAANRRDFSSVLQLVTYKAPRAAEPVQNGGPSCLPPEVNARLSCQWVPPSVLASLTTRHHVACADSPDLAEKHGSHVVDFPPRAAAVGVLFAERVLWVLYAAEPMLLTGRLMLSTPVRGQAARCICAACPAARHAARPPVMQHGRPPYRPSSCCRHAHLCDHTGFGVLLRNRNAVNHGLAIGLHLNGDCMF